MILALVYLVPDFSDITKPATQTVVDLFLDPKGEDFKGALRLPKNLKSTSLPTENEKAAMISDRNMNFGEQTVRRTGAQFKSGAGEQAGETTPTKVATQPVKSIPDKRVLPEIVPPSTVIEDDPFFGEPAKMNTSLSGFRAGDFTLPPLPVAVDLNAPDYVKTGSFTVLNTNASLFFSFLDRFNRLTYTRWATEVYSYFHELEYRGMSPRGTQTFSTVVELVLDRDGNYLNTIVLKSSGQKGLDMAIDRALQQARRIPNPPQEMIKGPTVRIKVLSTVHYVDESRALR